MLNRIPVVVSLVVVVAVCAFPTSAAARHDGQTSVLWAVGDADAGPNSQTVAGRITGQLDRFLYLGDVYETGTAAEFASNFDPVWWPFKGIGSPTPGNHDWANHATGYDPYWGSRAPQTGGGHFYSFFENGWEILSLNSEESMAVGSPQYQWLNARLASGGNCRIAFFHRPRYSAGSEHGDTLGTQPLWDLMANRVLYVVNGHEHNMQRAHPVSGITELIAGAGGKSLYESNEADARFAWIDDDEYGVLRLRLTAVGSGTGGGAAADHAFIAADDGATLDSGSRPCTPGGTTQTQTQTFTPTADALVDEGTPTKNSGASKRLRTNGGSQPDVESYLRFNVTGLSGEVSSVKLRLHATNATVDGPAVYTAPGTWAESTITWANRPTRSQTSLADTASIPAGTVAEYDITGAITANGSYDFALATTSTDGVDFYSREGSIKPELVITTSTSGDPPPDPPPTAPGGLTAIASAHNRVDLSWTAATDNGTVAGYQVFRDGAAIASILPATSFSDLTVTASTTYTYTVRAFDNTANWSSPSIPATVTTPPGSETQTHTFLPTADARIDESTPTSNYGTSSTLRANGGSQPDVESYLRFSVAGLSGQVTSAKLRLYVTNGTGDGPAVYTAPGTWSESGAGGITWQNRPARSQTAIADRGSTPAGAVAEWDVTSAITGNGGYDLALATTSTDGVDFYSREGTIKPELVITTE